MGDWVDKFVPSVFIEGPLPNFANNIKQSRESALTYIRTEINRKPMFSDDFRENGSWLIRLILEAKFGDDPLAFTNVGKVFRV